MPLRKLAIVTSHPIQYYAPVFRALTELGSLELLVFYTWSQSEGNATYDAGFGATLTWDIPLLEGYDYRFVPNIAKRPGVDHFAGLDNPTLLQDLRTWGADAVLIYGWNSRSHLRALRGLSGRIPVLFRGDSTLLDNSGRWRTLLRRVFLTWVYRHVDMAIAVGSNSRDYFEWCGIPPSRIAYAPHSIDIERFRADAATHEREAAAWRLRLGIEPGSVVFLYAGKFQYKKNPLLLLEAFLASGHGAHLLYVGAGELSSELELRAAGHANVHVLPFHNQSMMPTVYRLGDVFVLPSQGPGETWGLAINEAMTCGRPVIASNKVGSARDLIRVGQTGWIFRSADARELTTIIRRARACGRDGLRAMGIAAQAESVDWSAHESARCIRDAVLRCWNEEGLTRVRRRSSSKPKAPQ